MDANTQIQVILKMMVGRLVQDYQPQRIILFGSLAYGQPHADSDIDLLIIKNTEKSPLERRLDVRRLLTDPQRRIPFSPLVLTPNELAQRLAIGDPFYQEIITRGKVLYAND